MVGKDDSFRTDLSRARGYGSAKHGTSTWLTERLTSIALIPLGLWAVYAVLRLATIGYDGAVEWLQSPINAVLLVLNLAVVFHHQHLGMRVIIEDYIEHKGFRFFWILLSGGVCLLAGALSVYSILKVALGGAPA